MSDREEEKTINSKILGEAREGEVTVGDRSPTALKPTLVWHCTQISCGQHEEAGEGDGLGDERPCHFCAGRLEGTARVRAHIPTRAALYVVECVVPKPGEGDNVEFSVYPPPNDFTPKETIEAIQELVRTSAERLAEKVKTMDRTPLIADLHAVKKPRDLANLKPRKCMATGCKNDCTHVVTLLLRTREQLYKGKPMRMRVGLVVCSRPEHRPKNADPFFANKGDWERLLEHFDRRKWPRPHRILTDVDYVPIDKDPDLEGYE